jgi:hypothetical protein
VAVHSTCEGTASSHSRGKTDAQHGRALGLTESLISPIISREGLPALAENNERPAASDHGRTPTPSRLRPAPHQPDSMRFEEVSVGLGWDEFIQSADKIF